LSSAGLAEEGLDRVGPGRELGVQDLEGFLPPLDGVPHLVDPRRSALAELAHVLVAGQPGHVVAVGVEVEKQALLVDEAAA
jgi:hypothetical protein